MSGERNTAQKVGQGPPSIMVPFDKKNSVKLKWKSSCNQTILQKAVCEGSGREGTLKCQPIKGEVFSIYYYMNIISWNVFWFPKESFPIKIACTVLMIWLWLRTRCSKLLVWLEWGKWGLVPRHDEYDNYNYKERSNKPLTS